MEHRDDKVFSTNDQIVLYTGYVFMGYRQYPTIHGNSKFSLRKEVSTLASTRVAIDHAIVYAQICCFASQIAHNRTKNFSTFLYFATYFFVLKKAHVAQ
jgi:hypothetical protein